MVGIGVWVAMGAVLLVFAVLVPNHEVKWWQVLVPINFTFIMVGAYVQAYDARRNYWDALEQEQNGRAMKSHVATAGIKE